MTDTLAALKQVLATKSAEELAAIDILLLGAALTRHQRSVIFRRAYVELRRVEERLL